jgi:hypothetical protein
MDYVLSVAGASLNARAGYAEGHKRTRSKSLKQRPDRLAVGELVGPAGEVAKEKGTIASIGRRFAHLEWI